MKKGIILICMVTVLLAAGCGSTKLDSRRGATPLSMKQQMQTTMDKLNEAFPYIVKWSAYKTGVEPPRALEIVQQIVTAYPRLKWYVNAQGLFNTADYDKIERAIDTEDPNAKTVKISL